MNSQNEPFGQEFVISYVLNDYQKGSLVARFDGHPSTSQMKSFLSGYSLEPGAIREVTSQLAPQVSIQAPRSSNPTVQDNRRAEAQRSTSISTDTAPPQRRQRRTTSTKSKRSSNSSATQQGVQKKKTNGASVIFGGLFAFLVFIFSLIFSNV